MQLYLQLPTLTTDLDHFKHIFLLLPQGRGFLKKNKKITLSNQYVDPQKKENKLCIPASQQPIS